MSTDHQITEIDYTPVYVYTFKNPTDKKMTVKFSSSKPQYFYIDDNSIAVPPRGTAQIDINLTRHPKVKQL